VGFAPLTAQSTSAYTRDSVSDLVRQMFDTRNMMAAVNPLHGTALITLIKDKLKVLS
jgi:hypothetical protein